METFYTEDKILELVEKFETRKLLKEDWTHHAHLTVAVWHIKNYDLYEAICRLKSGIILLNSFHQTENTGMGGYHETITIFWATIIHIYLSMYKELSLEELVNSFLKSNLSDKNIVFKFYDRNNLMTPKLRAIYEMPVSGELDKFTVGKYLQ
jgi:hypothetical protein